MSLLLLFNGSKSRWTPVANPASSNWLQVPGDNLTNDYAAQVAVLDTQIAALLSSMTFNQILALVSSLLLIQVPFASNWAIYPPTQAVTDAYNAVYAQFEARRTAITEEQAYWQSLVSSGSLNIAIKNTLISLIANLQTEKDYLYVNPVNNTPPDGVVGQQLDNDWLYIVIYSAVPPTQAVGPNGWITKSKQAQRNCLAARIVLYNQLNSLFFIKTLWSATSNPTSTWTILPRETDN